MSSFHATLKVEGKEYEVINCVYNFGQNTDEKNRPSSDVRKGHISVELVSSDDDTLMGWMVDPYKKSSGSVVFEKIDQQSTMKELKFEDAYCVGYSERFSSTSSEPMITAIEISSRKMTMGNATHEVKW